MGVARPAQSTGTRLAALAAIVAIGLPLFARVSPPQAGETATEQVDHVLCWNEVALEAFRETGGTPGPLSRGGAMMNLIIYDVVNSIQPIGEPYLGEYDGLVGGRDGALNAAIDHAALAAARALPDDGSKEDQKLGRAAGELSAAAIVQDREGDGSEDTARLSPCGRWPWPTPPSRCGTPSTSPTWTSGGPSTPSPWPTPTATR